MVMASETTTHNNGTSGADVPVIIEGVRTPFLRSNGAFSNFMAYDLGRLAISGLMGKTGLSPKEVDQVIYGIVVPDPSTPNIARECMLGAGLSDKTPAHTVSMACITSNMAATTAADQIRLGKCKTAVIGGVDHMSDPPIRVSRNLRQALIRLQKAKSPAQVFGQIRKLSFKDLMPQVPSITEFSNGLTMGQGCERMAMAMGATRKESDEFAARSHQLAFKAQKEGVYEGDIIPIKVPPKFALVDQDNGPRGDTTVESLSKLRPAFDKKFGIVTAGSASFLTDGASAVLMMGQKHAEKLNYQPLAILKDYVFKAGDPKDEMLLGPALAIPDLLAQNNLTTADVDVWEIHEAFAAQVVCFFKAFQDKSFMKNRLGHDQTFGELPLEKINIYGGSLSLGHPFAATGGRLLTTASKRLQKEKAKYAVVAGCAAGGHGSAILLENPNL